MAVFTDGGSSGSAQLSTGSAALFTGNIPIGALTFAFPTTKVANNTTNFGTSGTTIDVPTNGSGSANGSNGTYSYNGSGTWAIGGVAVPAFTNRPCDYLGP